jgi:FeS assembly SUF system protein
MTRLNIYNTIDGLAPPEEKIDDQNRPYSSEPDLNSPLGRIEAKVVDALRKVFDPEIPVDIFELGLIYGVVVTEENEVNIRMTLTTPNCPVAQILPEQARLAAARVDGVTNASIELVWDPPWNPGMMTEVARLGTNS